MHIEHKKSKEENGQIAAYLCPFQLLSSVGSVVVAHKNHENLYRSKRNFFMHQNILSPLHCFNFELTLSALIPLMSTLAEKMGKSFTSSGTFGRELDGKSVRFCFSE